jgi:1-phosphofructokinase family hexose kinase
MIITLTPNPSVDQTLFVNHLEVNDVNRYSDSQLDPAGKGINVSRMAHRLGWPTIAFGFLGGEIGVIAERALDSEGVPHHFVFVPGQTRLNVTVVDETQKTSTSFYGPGPAVALDRLATLDGLLRFWLRAGRVLVLAGSLPASVPDGLHAGYVRLAQAEGVVTILDADGEAFRLGVEAGPTLIKPNREEAARLLGQPLPDTAAIIEGARELVGRGIPMVVISLGAEGAICADSRGVWQAVPPQIQSRSTVGSGDSLVAGLAVALARGDDIVEGLRLGTAAGAATAMTPGTSLGTDEEVYELLPHVEVEKVA